MRSLSSAIQKTVTTLILSLGLCSCATLMKKDKAAISFDSSPTESQVFIDQIYQGTTPLELHLKKDKDYHVTFRKEGFLPQTLTLSHRLSDGWVILDIMTGVVPAIVDAGTGSWYTLRPQSIYAVLDPHPSIATKDPNDESTTEKPRDLPASL